MDSIKKNINTVQLLHNISEKNFEEVKKIIQTLSVDINCRNFDGNIPLHYAIYVEDVRIVEYLLEKKADISIENNNNETPFDVALERKNEDIILLLGTEIINKSLEIVGKSESKTSWNTEQSASNEEPIEEIVITKRKILNLQKRLQALLNNNNNSPYEEVNFFILFLETFSIVHDSEDKEKVMNFFYGNNKSMKNNIGKMRSIILKRSANTIIKLDGVIRAIKYCYNGENKECKDQFFIELNRYLECLMQRDDESRSENLLKFNFFKLFPDNEKKNVVENNAVTDMQLKDFILNAYKDGVDWQEQWFEFIVNIYPGLDLNESLIKEANTNCVEKQLKHLRNNFVHEFHRFGIQEFKEAIINLRGKLLEYYFAESVHKTFQSFGVGPEKIEQSLSTDLEQLQGEFNVSGEVLPEQEAKNLFGYKFVKSVFPNKSLNNNNSDVKEYIEEYFKFMSIIEDLNRTSQEEDSMRTLDNEAGTEEDLNRTSEEEDSLKKLDSEASTDEDLNTTSQEEDSMKKLDDKARRELFEQFIRLRKIKEHCPDIYREEQQELMKKLKNYKIDEGKFDLVCRYYIEEGKGFDNKMSEVVADVFKFIDGINEVINDDFNDFKQINIIHLSEFILNKNSDSKVLVFSERNNLKSKFQELIEEEPKMKRLVDQVDSFNNVCIQVDNITLEIDLKQTIGNIIRTFYDAYNEYKIEFNIKEIFSSERFLNELIWQDIKAGALMKQNSKSADHTDKCLQYKTFGTICNLIDVEFLSPYIVKLIETSVKEKKTNNIINRNNLIKLIDNLLNRTEYDKYLNILLNVDFEDFELYEIFYDKVFEKKINVKDINLIFEDLTHLDKFIDVLLRKSIRIAQEYKSSTRYNNDVIELIKSVVEIMNQKVCSKLESNSYKSSKKESKIMHQILMKGKQIEEKFVEIIEKNYPGFIDRELLIVKIKSRNRRSDEALEILVKLEDTLKSDTIISHKTKYLLILRELAFTISMSDNKSKIKKNKYPNKSKTAYERLFIEVTKYILHLDDTNGKFDIIQTLKEKYDQIKDLDIYNRMLDSSKLFHSDKYLDLLKIAKDVTYWSNDNKDEWINALSINKEIYSCTKKHYGKDHRKTIQIVRIVANTYSKLSKFCWQERDYLNSLYYNQSALNMCTIAYNIGVKIFGFNHSNVTGITRQIAIIMYFTVQNYISIGGSKDKVEEKLKYYVEAYKINRKLYMFFSHLLDDKTNWTQTIEMQLKMLKRQCINLWSLLRVLVVS